VSSSPCLSTSKGYQLTARRARYRES
jgi:hypothetical protein